MIALARYIWDQFNEPPLSLEEKLEIIKTKYEIRRKQISDSTDDEEDDEHGKEVDETKTNPNQYFQQNGKVTQLNANDGRIDGKYYFQLRDANNLNLHVGCEVQYLARRESDDEPLKIIAIKSIVTDNWNENVDEVLAHLQVHNVEYFNEIKRDINGIIVDKKDDRLIIHLDGQMDDISVAIDDVNLIYQPMAGDDITASVIALTDRTKENFIGTITKIEKIIPFNLMRVIGIIKKMPNQNSKYGLIEDNNTQYIFYQNALDNADNLERKVGMDESVIGEAIASTNKFGYKTFNWRCIKVIRSEDREDDAMPLNLNEHVDNNVGGIAVTGSVDLKVTLRKLKDDRILKIAVDNHSKDIRKLMKITIVDPDSQLEIQSPAPNTVVILEPQKRLSVGIKINTQFFGTSFERIQFTFDGENQIVYRMIEVLVESQLKSENQNDVFYNNERNFSYTKSAIKKNSNVLRGERVKVTPNFVDVKLLSFEVSKTLANIVFGSSLDDVVEEELATILPSYDVLNGGNYEDCFHNLLHLEELQQIHSMRKYDREMAYFSIEGEYLGLDMPNILEMRPSLIVGDSVIVSQPNQPQAYEGVIHRIEKDRIFFKFHQQFHAQYKISRDDYKVVFKASRSSYVKQHNAIKSIAHAKVLKATVLFPEKIVSSGEQTSVRLTSDGNLQVGRVTSPFYNQSLNEVQKAAVVNVLQGLARPMPYVIFGPPGTGKTQTIIEIILQLYKKVCGCNILIATPSNSAANLITERLINSKVLKDGQFLRIVGYNALSRGLIPEALEPYCATIDITAEGTGNGDNVHDYIGKVPSYNSSEIKRQRIIIGTCNALGALLHLKMPKDHFSHVIVDEAGQCMEPEIIVPLSRVADKLGARTGQIILAGDPMQLGPIVLSKLAKARSLDKSFLVRILEQTPYIRDMEVSI